MRYVAAVAGVALATIGAATALSAQQGTMPPPGGTPARVPDGTYRCQMWLGSSYVSLGSVRSVGGRLTPNPLAKAGATITGVTPSAEGITIAYTTARGYRETLDCTRG